jgi:hypothetical protein
MEGFPPGAPPAGEYGKGVDSAGGVVVDVGVVEMYGYKNPGTVTNPGGALYVSFGWTGAGGGAGGGGRAAYGMAPKYEISKFEYSRVSLCG